MSPTPQEIAKSYLAGTEVGKLLNSAGVTPTVQNIGQYFSNNPIKITTPTPAPVSSNISNLIDKLGINLNDTTMAPNLSTPKKSNSFMSLINRVTDVLSRPEYALANSIKQGVKSAASGESVLKTLERTAGGAFHGLSGTQKTDFVNLLESIADYYHAASEGRTPSQAVYGEGNAGANVVINSFAKSLATSGGPASGLGLALQGTNKIVKNPVAGAGILADIVLDPLNLVGGAGIASKISEAGKLGAESVRNSSRVAETLDKLKNLGSDESDLNEIRRLVTRPVGEAPLEPSQIKATTNVVQTILDKAHPKLVEHATTQAEQELAKEGISKVDVPEVQRIANFESPNLANGKAWKKYLNVRNQHEARMGKLYAWENPHGMAESTFARKIRTLDKESEEYKNLMRDPRNGQILDMSPEKAWRTLAKLYNHGAVSKAEYASKETAYAKEVLANSPRLQSLRRAAVLRALRTAHLNQAGVSASDVAAVEARVGRDMSKLHLPKDARTGNPYTDYIGTLDTALKQGARTLGKRVDQLTDEQRTAIEDAWWKQIYTDEARAAKVASSPDFPQLEEDYLNNREHFAQQLYGDREPIEASRDIKRQVQFGRREYQALSNYRRELSKGLPNEKVPRSLYAFDRMKARSEPKTQFVHHVPTKLESGPKKLALAHNIAVGKKIAERADPIAREEFDGIQKVILEAMAKSTAPESLRRAYIVVAGKTIMAPEAISRYINHIINDNSAVRDSLNMFKRQFQTTPGMENETRTLTHRFRGYAIPLQHEVHEDLGVQFVKPGYSQNQLEVGLREALSSTANPIHSEITDKFNQHIESSLEMIRNPDNEHLGVTVETLNKFMPDRSKFELPKDKKILENAIFGDDKEHALSEFKKILSTTKNKEPLEFINDLHFAEMKMVANRMLRKTAEDNFGIKLKGSPTAEKLVRDYGYRELKGSISKGFIFDPKVADDLDRMYQLFYDYNGINELRNLLGGPLRLFKRLATIWNPTYTPRNLESNIWMNWVVGNMKGKASYTAYRQATKIMGRFPDELRGSYHPVEDLLNMAKQGRELNDDPIIFIRKGLNGGPPGGVFRRSMIKALYRREGLESSWASSTFNTTPHAATGVRKILHTADQAMIRGNAAVENWARYANFVYVLRNSAIKDFDKLSAEAAQNVRKALFDYSDFTQKEKWITANLIPFYKWNRKAVPVLLQALLARPGRILNFQTALKGIPETFLGVQQDPENPWEGVSGGLVPSWIGGRMSMPYYNYKGTTVFMDPSTPFNDEFRLFGDPQALTSQLNPEIRVPIELAQGRQFFHGLPINNKLEYATVGQAAPIRELQNLLSNTSSGGGPVSASGLGGESPTGAGFGGIDPRYLNLLGFLGVQTVSPQQQEQLQKQQKALKTQEANADIKKILAKLNGLS